MRQLQLQSGEETADRIERGADLVPGRLDGRDDCGLDPVPHGCGRALDAVEKICCRAFHGFKHRGDLALDAVHD